MLFDEAQRLASRLRDELGRAIIGQDAVVQEILTGFSRADTCCSAACQARQEGTYPLPEAQLDRFMFNVVIDYPSAAEEHRILALTTGDEEPVITQVATASDIEAMRHLVRDIPAASNIIDYALRIVRASRPAGGAEDAAALAYLISGQGDAIGLLAGLVGLQTNRETAHLVCEKESRGCTFANHWRNYPFLRMPNVQLGPGPKGSPTVDQMIADVKDGVLVEGQGSFSIDQQRYNGQFGGDAFWEIKNGKKTRMVTDFTYYDNPGTALVPAMKIEDFRMTSISPAV